ncbi:MAG: hypothetical protein KJN79_00120 [Gammaproteobacteria bacterium]|nr:hypothetical protein [Gammaproteobacteria bacterium]
MPKGENEKKIEEKFDYGQWTWIGKNALIMTLTTHYWMGRIVGIDEFSIYLEDAAWVFDVGRHHKVLASGKPDDHTAVEPHPDGAITALPRAGSVIIEWKHELWREAL